MYKATIPATANVAEGTLLDNWSNTSPKMPHAADIKPIQPQLQPELAIEIGTAEGGSLRRVAHHSTHVHSFDLVEPPISEATAPMRPPSRPLTPLVPFWLKVIEGVIV